MRKLTASIALGALVAPSFAETQLVERKTLTLEAAKKVAMAAAAESALE